MQCMSQYPFVHIVTPPKKAHKLSKSGVSVLQLGMREKKHRKVEGCSKVGLKSPITDSNYSAPYTTLWSTHVPMLLIPLCPL